MVARMRALLGAVDRQPAWNQAPSRLRDACPGCTDGTALAALDGLRTAGRTGPGPAAPAAQPGPTRWTARVSARCIRASDGAHTRRPAVQAGPSSGCSSRSSAGTNCRIRSAHLR